MIDRKSVAAMEEAERRADELAEIRTQPSVANHRASAEAARRAFARIRGILAERRAGAPTTIAKLATRNQGRT